MARLDPATLSHLAAIALQAGADVIDGTLHYPSDTGGWQIGGIDLEEYLEQFQDQRIVLIVAPLGDNDPHAYRCQVCGTVLSEGGDCPECKRMEEEQPQYYDQWADEQRLLRQIENNLRRQGGQD